MLDEADSVEEELRLKYRYIDLRRPLMQSHFKLRHDIIFAMREYLHNQAFYEFETPILTKIRLKVVLVNFWFHRVFTRGKFMPCTISTVVQTTFNGSGYGKIFSNRSLFS